MDLDTAPSDICPQLREPAIARGLVTCRMQPTPKSRSSLPTSASYRRCSTRSAQSMPNFCAAAGAILANMIEAYLAGGALPSNAEGADHDDLEDCRSPSVAPSLHLHSSVDDGASPLQSGEHRTPVQFGEQGAVSRLESGTDPHPRPGSRPVRRANSQSRGLQDAGQRRGDGPSRRDLLLGSVAAGALEPGLASPARVV